MSSLVACILNLTRDVAAGDSTSLHQVTSEDFAACLQRMAPSLSRGVDIELAPGGQSLTYAK